MSKVIITADIHLGIANRTNDIMWALNNIQRYAIENNIDTVLVLGDLFHDRFSLDIEVLSVAHKFFKKCRELGQQWIVFPGNHDMYLKYSWDINSLECLDGLITLIDSVKLLRINGYRYWVVPFIFHENAYLKVINHISEYCEEGDQLLTHIGINSAVLNVCFQLEHWKMINLESTPFSKIWTGHFHVHQDVGKVTYPGGPIPFKFDEGNVDHGFIVYEHGSETYEFVNLFEYGHEPRPPMFLTVAEQDINNLTQDEVSNNNIRIAFTDNCTESEKDSALKLLSDRGARSVRPIMPKPNLELKKANEFNINSGYDLFANWLDLESDNIGNLNRNLLLSLNQEIVLESDDIYSTIADNE